MLRTEVNRQFRENVSYKKKKFVWKKKLNRLKEKNQFYNKNLNMLMIKLRSLGKSNQ